jgi:histidinol-phosphate aminotransferase
VKPASLAKPYVLSLPEYVPGKPIDDVARDLGLDPSGIIKLASNENAFGPSPLAAEAAKRAIEQGQLYPDGECFALRAKLAQFHGLSPAAVRHRQRLERGHRAPRARVPRAR